ncbi:hypothetical protein SMAC4_13107 [Sordaria macrospora]|uniref:uncharacterized protein n=1 Tax=Sordaria macrospora TaxID=5147 RepID=UPI002B2A2391|nr:hypothetical protein SMAC4_13107 [Sordaria macrospora]
MPPPTSVPTPAVTPAARLVVTSFNHVPLTTTFSPPGECFGVSSSDVYLIDQQTSCLPSGWSSAETAFFSPGLVCPNGYMSACHDNGGVSTITTVTCCPQRGPTVWLSCVAEPTKLASSLKDYMCAWTAPAAGYSTDVTRSPNGKTVTTSETLKSPDAIYAYGVRMVYQSTDKSTTGTAVTTGTKTTNGTSAATSAMASTKTSASPSSVSGSSNSTVSTTAVVIIAVCITVVICGIVASLFLWWRRRSQPQHPSGPNSDAPSSIALTPESPVPNAPDLQPLHSNVPAQVMSPTAVSTSDRMRHVSMQSSMWNTMPPSPPPAGPLPYHISKSLFDHQDDVLKRNRQTEISNFSASDTTTAFDISNAVELPVRSSASELPTPR